jgi:molybdenum cofactor synthesis domain-containing protein
MVLEAYRKKKLILFKIKDLPVLLEKQMGHKDQMSSSTPDASLLDPSIINRTPAAVLTVSDSCSRGEKVDLSGPAVAEALSRRNFQVVVRSVVADERAAIQEKLIELCRSARLVVTTGGTGIAPRDVTPEATSAVCDRLVEGIAEHMRFQGMGKTPFAALSRAVCGVRGTSLILNLPGSPAGSVESLEAVMDLLPHALELIAGKTAHE